MWLIAAFACGPEAPALKEPPEGTHHYGFAGFQLWKTNRDIAPLLQSGAGELVIPEKDTTLTVHPKIAEWPDAKAEGVCQLADGFVRYCTWSLSGSPERLDEIEKALVATMSNQPPVTPTSSETAERRYEWTLDPYADVVIVRTRALEGKAIPVVGLTYGKQVP